LQGKTKIAVAVLAALLFVLLIGFQFNSNEAAERLEERAVNARESISPTVERTSGLAVNQPNGSQEQGINKQTPHREMLEAYNHSQNLRAFLHEALKHPELGGNQYATVVLEQCRKFASPLEPPGISPGPVGEAQRQLVMRCDMSAQERDELHRQLLPFDGRKNIHEDPLYQLSSNLLFSDSAEQRRAAIAAILDNGDPVILLSLLQIEPANPEQPDSPRIYFAGKWYETKESVAQLFLAHNLASCNMGVDCGGASTLALLLCAGRQYCGDSVADAIRTGVSANGGEEFETISRLADVMTAAFKNRDVNSFLSPTYK
jgi:hypothetical protein